MEHSPIAGVVFGLAAAILQSASYVFSRLFVVRHANATARLLITSHIWMGIMAVVVFPFVWTSAIPSPSSFAVPLVSASFYYALGQAGLFVLMRHTQASRVAPLLGLKILVLAAIATLFLGQVLLIHQWSAVVLCVVAALLLNSSGARLPVAALFWLAVACIGYSLSDINITRLVHSLAPLPRFHASVVGVCLSYALCGLVALCLLPFSGIQRSASDWRYAFPFAFFWFTSMIVLFTCFGLVGPVYGNILQSTRGIISIVMGVMLARAGFLHLEEQVSRRLLMQRVAAACLMVTAIALFHWGRTGN